MCRNKTLAYTVELQVRLGVSEACLDNHARIKPVEAGIGAVRKCAHGVCELALARDEASDLLRERCVSPVLVAVAVHVAEHAWHWRQVRVRDERNGADAVNVDLGRRLCLSRQHQATALPRERAGRARSCSRLRPPSYAYSCATAEHLDSTDICSKSMDKGLGVSTAAFLRALECCAAWA